MTSTSGSSGPLSPRVAASVRHLVKPTLFKCEQTQMGLCKAVQTWDSMDDTSQTLKPSRNREGRIGREASGDDRRDQDRPWTIESADRNGLAARGGHFRAGHRFLGLLVAWSDPRPRGDRRLVLALVIFMLLERRDLRDRLIGLFGYGQLTVTTKAFDEAGTRVSRPPRLSRINLTKRLLFREK
jgi:hypothetical protein